MQTFLLTGANGFLGSHLAHALVQAGHRLIALKRRNSNIARLQDIHHQIIFHDREDCSPDDLFLHYPSIDAVIHTATCYGRKQETSAKILEANVLFPLQLLDAAMRHGTPRFLNTDTFFVKGSDYLGQYVLTKRQFVQWGELYAKQHGMQFLNLRLEQLYGPGDDATKFVPFVVHACLSNQPELLLSPGKQTRDFIYVADAVSAYMQILSYPGEFPAPCMTFELGSGHETTLEAFVTTVHQVTASRTRLRFGAKPYLDGEIMHSVANTATLTALGWRPLVGFDRGIRMLVESEQARS